MRVELEGTGKKRPLKGELSPPPDKSISHRAAMFASLAEGESLIKNYLKAADTRSTLRAMEMLGAEIGESGGDVRIRGKGLYLKEPPDVIDCGNSGTTMRLLAGLLSGNDFFSVLTGDDSLRARPMGRVITPLTGMGARIIAREGAKDGGKFPPMAIRGGGLKGISYPMPVASAQVKSAVLLAGLYADGETTVVEPLPSRDHTERMLRSLGADIRIQGERVSVRPKADGLKGFELAVPGDISSAAFFIVGALIIPRSELLIKAVGVNPRRTGLLPILEKMGGRIRIENLREISGEPVADIYVEGGNPLTGVAVGKEDIPLMIDEVPALCIAAASASGRTTIKGAGELRVKESDRIRAMAEGLKAMGAGVEELPDGLIIEGGRPLRGAQIESFHDHRVAMAFSIAALAAREGDTTVIEAADSVNISYPGFFEALKRLSGG